jgi:hypothetical protein
MKMARSADGTPCQPPSFNPYRGGYLLLSFYTDILGSAKISFFAKISTAFRDLIEVLLVPTGPFDTVCSLNKYVANVKPSHTVGIPTSQN